MFGNLLLKVGNPISELEILGSFFVVIQLLLDGPDSLLELQLVLCVLLRGRELVLCLCNPFLKTSDPLPELARLLNLDLCLLLLILLGLLSFLFIYLFDKLLGRGMEQRVRVCT